MRTYELLFGALSIVSFILTFKFTDKAYQIVAIFTALFILMVTYLSSNIKTIRETAESSSNEIKKLKEKIKVYEKLVELESRISNLEKGGFKK